MELLTGPDLASVLEQTGPLPDRHGFARSCVRSWPRSGEGSRAWNHPPRREAGQRDPRAGRGAWRAGEDHRFRNRESARRPRGNHGRAIRGDSALHVARADSRRERRSECGSLYAVAVTMFQMLTGRLAFRRASLRWTEVLEQQLYAERPDPRETRRDCPDELAQVCLQSLDLDPEKRFATADAFAEALEGRYCARFAPAGGRRSPVPGSREAAPRRPLEARVTCRPFVRRAQCRRRPRVRGPDQST